MCINTIRITSLILEEIAAVKEEMETGAATKWNPLDKKGGLYGTLSNLE